jgi:exopolysaccharide/PEP-CTERM locus tyrosine autokinase
MSSLIEQAAARLEQLRKAGIEIPEREESAPSAAQALARSLGIEAAPPAARADAPRQPDPSPPAVALAPPETVPTSRRVELDLAAIAAAGIVTPNAPRSRLADQYRVLKRPLLANAMGRGAATIQHANLIMVTSALAGEGKSFTSINLAMSIATELDHTVMLVDADVARPSVLRMLGLPAGPGLLDLLEGRATMSEVLLRTNVDKLSILPSGNPHPKATELLASDAMVQLLDDMATRYPDRVIIFDSPPLLLTTESRVLASHMGQIVVVVQAGRTLQSTVMQALATVETCPVKMAVLNRASGDAEGAYGYADGYGYGYGGGSPDAVGVPSRAKS